MKSCYALGVRRVELSDNLPNIKSQTQQELSIKTGSPLGQNIFPRHKPRGKPCSLTLGNFTSGAKAETGS